MQCRFLVEHFLILLVQLVFIWWCALLVPGNVRDAGDSCRRWIRQGETSYSFQGKIWTERSFTTWLWSALLSMVVHIVYSMQRVRCTLPYAWRPVHESWATVTTELSRNREDCQASSCYDKLRLSSPWNDMKRSLFSAPKISSAFLRVSCGAAVYVNMSNNSVKVLRKSFGKLELVPTSRDCLWALSSLILARKAANCS